MFSALIRPATGVASRPRPAQVSGLGPGGAEQRRM